MLNELLQNSAVIAISVFISGFVSRWFFSHKTAILQKELEELRHRSAVSTQTYQELFKERLSLYQDLVIAFEEYDTTVKVHASHWFDEDGSHDVYNNSFYELSTKLMEKIKPNQILVSKELSEKYRTAFNSQHVLLKAISAAQYERVPNLDERIELRAVSESQILQLYDVVLGDIDQLRSAVSDQF